MKSLLVVISIIGAATCAGLAWSAYQDIRTRSRAQSWDQENLKRNDSGCPRAVYSASTGLMRLCTAVDPYRETTTMSTAPRAPASDVCMIDLCKDASEAGEGV